MDELTPGSRVSQGASMQGMHPDSPWYHPVSRPGIRLPHPHFTLIGGRRREEGPSRGWEAESGCVSLHTMGAVSVGPLWGWGLGKVGRTWNIMLNTVSCARVERRH